jgi:hypothetical protein
VMFMGRLDARVSRGYYERGGSEGAEEGGTILTIILDSRAIKGRLRSSYIS